VNEFVEECRTEWRRLGVRDVDANEMAADLAADIAEAEAEGGSAEDVLGTSAFDPRGFAAAWAAARGLTGLPVTVSGPAVLGSAGAPASGRRRRAAPVAAVVLGLVAAAAALVVADGAGGQSFAFAVRRIAVRSGSVGITPGPGPRLGVPGQLLRPVMAGQVGDGGMQLLAFLVFVVAMVALVVLIAVRWSPWTLQRRSGRGPRAGGPPVAGWS